MADSKERDMVLPKLNSSAPHSHPQAHPATNSIVDTITDTGPNTSTDTDTQTDKELVKDKENTRDMGKLSAADISSPRLLYSSVPSFSRPTTSSSSPPPSTPYLDSMIHQPSGTANPSKTPSLSLSDSSLDSMQSMESNTIVNSNFQGDDNIKRYFTSYETSLAPNSTHPNNFQTTPFWYKSHETYAEFKEKLNSALRECDSSFLGATHHIQDPGSSFPERSVDELDENGDMKSIPDLTLKKKVSKLVKALQKWCKLNKEPGNEIVVVVKARREAKQFLRSQTFENQDSVEGLNPSMVRLTRKEARATFHLYKVVVNN